MSFQVFIRSVGGPAPGSAFQVDRNPDKCPICHVSITPIDWTIGASRADGQVMERLLQCPNQACRHLFLARYAQWNQTYALQHCVPSEISVPAQSDTIKGISDDFCKIYEEANKAELLSLKSTSPARVLNKIPTKKPLRRLLLKRCCSRLASKST